MSEERESGTTVFREEVGVLIVGAGPIGLTLAVRVAIALPIEPRAITLPRQCRAAGRGVGSGRRPLADKNENAARAGAAAHES
jgi:ribulose 1,5-bisphosphate synthetase/thiazole synthase